MIVIVDTFSLKLKHVQYCVNDADWSHVILLVKEGTRDYNVQIDLLKWNHKQVSILSVPDSNCIALVLSGYLQQWSVDPDQIYLYTNNPRQELPKRKFILFNYGQSDESDESDTNDETDETDESDESNASDTSDQSESDREYVAQKRVTNDSTNVMKTILQSALQTMMTPETCIKHKKNK